MKSDSLTSDWQKGGFRHAKLKAIIPNFLAPEKVLMFFVGVKGKGGRSRLANPFTPLQREYVIAATTNDLVVLKLRRPGVFRASIAGTVYRARADGQGIGWKDGQLTIDGSAYSPIAFHQEDAEAIAQHVGAASKD